jgi:predicted transcriptional regulator
MPCIQPESSLPESEIKVFLNLIKEHALPIKDITAEIKQPIFKVRSILRELMNLGYIHNEVDKYIISAKGKMLLS